MKILVFGKTGQVATELALQQPADAEVVFVGREQADFTQPEQCVAILDASDADVVINAVAYTAVDKAESDEAVAQLVNGDTPTALVRAATARNIPLSHISTDYVFDGQGDKPWTVECPTAPLGAYGRTKLVGEQGIAAAGGEHVILRASWVVSAYGNNFVKTMVRLGQERDELSIVADQIGGPTPARDIASAMYQIAMAYKHGNGVSGVFHYAGQPNVSWADFARNIFDAANLHVNVVDIVTTEYPTPAVRRPNSRLDCSALQQAYGIDAPSWQQGLQQILADITN